MKMYNLRDLGKSPSEPTICETSLSHSAHAVRLRHYPSCFDRDERALNSPSLSLLAYDHALTRLLPHLLDIHAASAKNRPLSLSLSRSLL